MKKTLISLSIVSAFTLPASQVFAYELILGDPGTHPFAIVIGKGSSNIIGGSTTAGIAIGQDASSEGDGIALGHSSHSETQSLSIGFATTATKYSVALGHASHSGIYSTALGFHAKATTSRSVAVGDSALTEGDNSVAIGANAKVSKVKKEEDVSGGVAIGYQAGVQTANGVAIGSHSFANRAAGDVATPFENRTALSYDSGTWVSSLGAVAVGTSFDTRQIIGVAAGTADTDAVNYGQLKNLKQYGDDFYSTQDDLKLARLELSNQFQNLANEFVNLNATVTNLDESIKKGLFTVGTSNAQGGTNPGGTQQGGNASVNNSAKVHLGENLNFTTDSNLLATVTKEDGGPATVKISMAENVSVNSLKAQEVQAENIVANNSLTAPSITFTDGATLSYNKDTGHLQYVSNSTTGGTGQGSVVHSIATTSDGITFGANEGSALVNLDNQKLDIKGADEFITTSIKTNGSGATLEIKMTDEFRIAVGNGNLNNGITIGAKDGYQEIHIHQGNINMGGNRIQGVGDGIAPTDAVNKRQLDNAARGIYNKINKVDKDMRAGVAMAMAVASLPQAYMPGKSMLAMSAGTYRGQGGFALGLSHATENKSWVFKGAATADTRGNFGATIGAGYQF